MTTSSFFDDESPCDSNYTLWQNLGAELVFSLNRSFRYTSFYWQGARQYDLNAQMVLGSTIREIFIPVALEDYEQRITNILDQKIPQQAYWYFQYLEHCCPFELMISPIISQDGEAHSVLVIGRQLTNAQVGQTSYSPLAIYADPYQKLLTNIVRKIRRTVDLATIWQETVDSLGATLKVGRALLIYCNSQERKLEVRGEYRKNASIPSLLGNILNFELMPYLKTAMVSKEPVVFESLKAGACGEYSVLVLSTFYEDQHNGLICLQDCHEDTLDQKPRSWSQAEVEFVKKIGEQVGTAIAYGTLYQELEEARQKAEEASRLKSEFLRNTSHELRTPLNSIIGFLQFILEGLVEDPEQQREFLELSYNSSLYLLNLIDDLLDIARIESGKMDLELTTINLNDIFQKVEEITRNQAEAKGLSFQIKLPSAYQDIVTCSNYKTLVQVMLNLVGNSIKFTQKGGVKVNARLIIDPNKKIRYNDIDFPGFVEISVADTGIGVALDKQDKIFDSFVQTDGSRTRAYSGTGLGLAISKKLVEAMGGKISFYSLGEGLGAIVTFTVLLNHRPVMKTAEAAEDFDFLAT